MEIVNLAVLPEVTSTGVVIKGIIILAIISAIAGFGTYIERKILAFMQRRLGPMHVGPYGLLQIAADGIKLFTQEDIIPQNANKLIFKVAPAITAATAFIALAAVQSFLILRFLNGFLCWAEPSSPRLPQMSISVYSSFWE